jgi:hypothetical protein
MYLSNVWDKQVKLQNLSTSLFREKKSHHFQNLHHFLQVDRNNPHKGNNVNKKVLNPTQK